jgi:hypothetical protein
MSQFAEKPMPRAEALAKVKMWNAQTLARHAEPGTQVYDSSIALGISPTTGKKIYALPQDADVRLSFNNAAAYVAQLNKNKTFGHDDWRLPSAEELKLLCDMQKTGTFSGTFNWASKPVENTPGDALPLYWSSQSYTQKWLAEKAKSINFKDGIPEIRLRANRLCVRVIR